MSITVERKVEIVEKFRRDEADCGSPEVQIALLTERIVNLTEHFRAHRHDFSSRRGLMKMVSQRNSLLRYLARTNRDSYLKLIATLGLRK